MVNYFTCSAVAPVVVDMSVGAYQRKVRYVNVNLTVGAFSSTGTSCVSSFMYVGLAESNTSA